jgi:hypothetical protein
MFEGHQKAIPSSLIMNKNLSIVKLVKLFLVKIMFVLANPYPRKHTCALGLLIVSGLLGSGR